MTRRRGAECGFRDRFMAMTVFLCCAWSMKTATSNCYRVMSCERFGHLVYCPHAG